jgi:hypothetical protein
MFLREEVVHMVNLYRNIFDEDAYKSKEFLNFVDDKPNLLRLKLDEVTQEINKQILNMSVDTDPGDLHNILNRMSNIKELDAIVMNYIENHYD